MKVDIGVLAVQICASKTDQNALKKEAAQDTADRCRKPGSSAGGNAGPCNTILPSLFLDRRRVKPHR
jgi:hypothetical protein